jgi:hypothetical protein
VDPAGWRYKRAGWFGRSIAPCRIQRYRCLACKKAFSSQTFSLSYRLRRPDLLEAVLHAEVSCSGHRQQARQHRVSHATVQRLVGRIGRHCILIHESLRARARDRLASEPVVLDGLGSFARGQYWPLEITGLVGSRSYYSHDFVVTALRRSGSMTRRQKKRREAYEKRYGRPDPGALRKDVLELMEAALPEAALSEATGPEAKEPAAMPIELRTDEKRQYKAALKRLRRPGIAHRTTHSKAPRTPTNPLFAVNTHHALLRHSASNHKRETVAFSKCFKSVVWRHAIYQVWQNLVKSASERDPTQTPAQRLGVTSKRWRVSELLELKLSVTRMAMRSRVLEAYLGVEPGPFSEMARGAGEPTNG